MFRTSIAGLAAATCLLIATSSIAGAKQDASLSAKEAADGGHGAATLAAVVDFSGNLQRGVGVSSTTRQLTGVYQVRFQRPVNMCVFSAISGNTGTGTPDFGVAVVAATTDVDDGVMVRTFNSNGVATNRPFHLTVNCWR